MYELKIKIGNNEPNFGKGIVQLMVKSDKYGSLSAAYKEMGMSSSKAWKIIKRAEEDLGFSLFETKSGGSHGGSTVLTQQGLDLLHAYTSFMLDVDSYVEKQFQRYFNKKENGI